MKKFFQNIKFKKVSLTTLALALVVSGFLFYGNKIEAEITSGGISVDSPISSSLIYAKDGDASIPVQIDVTTDATGSGKIRVEILPGIGDTTWFDYEFTVLGANNNIAINVPLNSGISEGTYDLKVSAQQPAGTGVVQTITVVDVVVIDNTLPTVESVSVNDESIAEGDVGTDKFVVTVNFTDTNPMDMVTDPAITFDPALDTTITSCSSLWTDSNTLTYTCNIEDGNVESADVDIKVSGAKDAAGNTMSGTFTESNEFDVDTIAPTVTATIEPNKGTAKVGDTITATLTEGGFQADLDLSGTCTINGVDVTDSFTNNGGGTYTLSYVIAETNTDRTTGNLPVSCTLVETSGNTVTLSSFVANTLVVDANSPAAPVVTSIAGDHKINDSEKAAVIIVGTAEANATINGLLTGTGTNVTVSGAADGSGNFSITVDASGLADGTLSLSITATDTAGNESDAGTSSAVKDIEAPVISSVTSDTTGTGVLKVGDTIIFTVTMSATEDGLVIAPTAYNGGTLEWSTANSGATYTATYTIAEGQADQSPALQLTGVTATDTFGNTSGAVSGSDVTDTIDANKPTGYSVTFDQDYANSSNETAISFTFAGAEVGATYNYSIDDIDNAESAVVTGTGTISSDTNQITGIDVSSLDDETLTITVTLTDPAGNIGDGVTDTIVKDIVAPTGYSVTFDQTYVNNTNKADISFTFAGAEVGATYNYSIDDIDNAESAVVTGTGTISSDTNQITGIDVSSLDDETLTITVTLTDPAGNAGAGVTDTIVKDIVAPVINTVTSGATGAGVLKVGDTITFTVTMNATEAGLTIAPTAYNGGTLVWSAVDSGATYTATYTIAEGQNDQGTALQLTGVTATDTFGNTSSPATGGVDIVKTIDANSPTVTSVVFDDTALKIGDNATVTITMSEAVSGFTKDDVTVSGGTLGDDLSTEDNTVFTGTFTPDASTEAPTNVATVGTGFTDIALNPALTSVGATSANYAIDTLAPTLPVDGIVGITKQGAGDQIILTFSEAVSPDDEVWSADEFTSIGDGASFDLSGASFVATTTGEGYTQLTITLDEDPEDEDTYLWNGNYLTVDPANGAIVDAAGNELSDSAVTGTTAVTGDTVAPTLGSITYTQGETPVTVIKPSTYGLVVRVTATFSELMHSAPTIAIDAPRTDADMDASPLSRTSGTVWYKDWTVPNIDAVQGIATITLAGTDLAGVALNSASSSVTIDERGPVIQNGGIILDKDSYRVTQDPNVTVTVIEDNTAESVTVNGVSATETSTPGTWTGTFDHSKDSVGTYSFDVVATDANGNATKIQSYSYRIIEDDEVVAEPTDISVTNTSLVKRFATKNGLHDDGWKWIIDVTLPTSMTSIEMSFSDFTGAGTIDAENIRFYSAQSSDHTSSTPISITESGVGTVWSDDMTLSGDLSSNPGRQIQIVIQAAVPESSIDGSYSANYDIQEADSA